MRVKAGLMPRNRFSVLATDYDGTLALKGRVAEATIAALRRFRTSGGRLVLVTGRVLGELRDVCPCLDLFERVVVEDGAVLHRPGDGSTLPLAGPPPAALWVELNRRGVGPIALGEVVLATWEPHADAARAAIEATGLPYEVHRNKRAVMLLPRGVNKATGLDRALAEMGVEPADVAAVGDAENDRPFLRLCGLAVAVANALPAVTAEAAAITEADHGAGVVELIERLLAGWPLEP